MLSANKDANKFQYGTSLKNKWLFKKNEAPLQQDKLIEELKKLL